MEQKIKDIITGIWKVMLIVMTMAYSMAIIWAARALSTIIINSIFFWDEIKILGNRTVIGTAVGFIDIFLMYLCLKFTNKHMIKSKKTKILWLVLTVLGMTIGYVTYPYLSQVVG